jgi:hypothetical protein
LAYAQNDYQTSLTELDAAEVKLRDAEKKSSASYEFSRERITEIRAACVKAIEFTNAPEDDDRPTRFETAKAIYERRSKPEI